jgi:Integrase core domain
MDPLPPPLAFFLLLFSGWINRQQQAVIDYLREENRVLRAAYGPRRGFFVMKLKTGTVEIAGITSQPDEPWMTQMARNLTDPHDGFLRDAHHLILDRDPLYTAAFRNRLRDSGVTLVRVPARSPNLKAFAERFVGSVRAECVARIVPLGEAHLRATVRAFVDHYHEERPHQGLCNELIAPKTTSVSRGPVRCRERLGGLLKFYYRAAA